MPGYGRNCAQLPYPLPVMIGFHYFGAISAPQVFLKSSLNPCLSHNIGNPVSLFFPPFLILAGLNGTDITKDVGGKSFLRINTDWRSLNNYTRQFCPVFRHFGHNFR